MSRGDASRRRDHRIDRRELRPVDVVGIGPTAVGEDQHAGDRQAAEPLRERLQRRSSATSRRRRRRACRSRRRRGGASRRRSGGRRNPARAGSSSAASLPSRSRSQSPRGWRASPSRMSMLWLLSARMTKALAPRRGFEPVSSGSTRQSSSASEADGLERGRGEADCPAGPALARSSRAARAAARPAECRGGREPLGRAPDQRRQAHWPLPSRS